MPEIKSKLTNQAEEIERHQKNEEWLKSLKNGQIIELPNNEVLQFLKFVELSNPNLSFEVKIRTTTKIKQSHG